MVARPPPPGVMRVIRSSVLPIMCLWCLVLSYEHRHPMNEFWNPDESDRRLQADTCSQACEIVHVSNLESPRQWAHLRAAAKPRLLLPCRHSVALSHPEVYKKMRVSWETGILPQFSLSPFFPLLFSVSRHPVPGHVPPPLSLTPHTHTPPPVPSRPLSFQNSQQWWCRFSIWGKSLHCLTFPFSFIFLFRAFVFFYGVQTNI